MHQLAPQQSCHRRPEAQGADIREKVSVSFAVQISNARDHDWSWHRSGPVQRLHSGARLLQERGPPGGHYYTLLWMSPQSRGLFVPGRDGRVRKERHADQVEFGVFARSS